MTDISTLLGYVGTATSSIVGATEAGKNLKQLFGRSEVDVTASKQLVLDLLDKLIDAKSAQMEIQEGVLALQRELQQRDQFEADLVRYELRDTGRGAMVYRLKSDHSGGQPEHSICPACVAKRVKSILQPATGRLNCLQCPICRAEFLADRGQNSDIMVISGRSTRDFSGF